MGMKGVEDDPQRKGQTGQGGTTLPAPAGMESNGRSTRSKETGEQLLPGIPNEITLDLITPKFSWRDFPLLSSISRTWQRALQGGQVSEARGRTNSAETLVVVSHMRSPENTHGEDIHAISLYSMKQKRTFELPPIPDLSRGLPYSCQFVSLDGKLYILGGAVEPDSKLGRAEVYVLDMVGGRTQWKPCASMHEPRLKLGCSVCDGKIYVFGGTSLDGPIYLTEVYDPKIDAWSLKKSILFSSIRQQVVTVGSEILVQGGEHWGTSSYLKVYTPDMDQWRLTQPFQRGYLGKLFVAQGKPYSITELGIYSLALDTDESSRTLLQYSSYVIELQENSTIVPLAAVAVDDELLVRVIWHERDVCLTCKSRLFQSRGFGSEDKVIIWERTEDSFSFKNLRSCGNFFLTSIQL